MRMIKKGGSTPSGRRLDRRKMAIAAAAALLITAATARANVVDFVVNQSQSSLTVTSTQLLNAFDDSFPNDSTVPQDGGGGIGATTNFYGHLYVDLNPGTVQLLAGSSLSAARNGNWYPAQTGDGTVTQASSGLKEPGNYGLSYAFVGDKERQDGIRLDVFNGLNPPMPLSGTNFNLGDTFMQMVSGTSFNFNGPVIDLVPPFANLSLIHI